VHQRSKAFPERGGLDAGSRQHVVVDEAVQGVGHVQSVEGVRKFTVIGRVV
jgi:hypothetical protein